MAEPVADFIAVAFTAIFFSFQFKKALRKISGKDDKPGPNTKIEER